MAMGYGGDGAWRGWLAIFVLIAMFLFGALACAFLSGNFPGQNGASTPASEPPNSEPDKRGAMDEAGEALRQQAEAAQEQFFQELERQAAEQAAAREQLVSDSLTSAFLLVVQVLAIGLTVIAVLYVGAAFLMSTIASARRMVNDRERESRSPPPAAPSAPPDKWSPERRQEAITQAREQERTAQIVNLAHTRPGHAHNPAPDRSNGHSTGIEIQTEPYLNPSQVRPTTLPEFEG